MCVKVRVKLGHRWCPALFFFFTANRINGSMETLLPSPVFAVTDTEHCCLLLLFLFYCLSIYLPSDDVHGSSSPIYMWWTWLALLLSPSISKCQFTAAATTVAIMSACFFCSCCLSLVACLSVCSYLALCRHDVWLADLIAILAKHVCVTV